MTFLATIGRATWEHARGLSYTAAVVFAVLTTALDPRSWPRTAREALSRQIVSAGADAVGLISFIAFLAGILIVVQVQLWLNKVAQSRLLGPVLVTVVIRELAPLMANLLCIARSGQAITAQLANMKLSGQVRSLDAQGLDPFTYLVVPRVLGVTIATFCLTLIFILVCLAGGYFFARIIDVHVGGLAMFGFGITRAIGRADLLNVVTKAAIPPLVWSAISCVQGLGVGEGVGDITPVMYRSLRHSVVSLFVIITIVSVLTYA